MKEIKTCRDAFVLPLVQSGVEVCEQSATKLQNYDVASFSYAYQARFAARAINHIDALADVIENVLHHHGDSLSYEIKSWAQEALASYRGEA